MSTTMRTPALPDQAEVVLVGAGIMSATLATLLHELAPGLSMHALERLDGVAQESTEVMNNAGTGHAAYCELNYTPEQPDGSIDIAKAITINAAYEQSLSLWSYLVESGALPGPDRFLRPVPHMSFVWGESNVGFLGKRHARLAAHPYFQAMTYSEDHAQIREWAPLVMDGRDPTQKIAATRMARGTDVDFGVLTRLLFEHLERRAGLGLHLRHQVTGLRRASDGRWDVAVKDLTTGSRHNVRAGFVFLGAGGGALALLAGSGIPEGRGYGGFPVSGQWLVCRDPDVAARHDAKVYGKASVGAPPMSVPHLDTRIVDGQRALLFGPYAGFSTKFLKAGSYLDLPRSLNLGNLVPMLAAGLDNLTLTRYLIGQVLQSQDARLAALREFMPTAKHADWELAVAGQRVQIIKPDPARRGKLEFGTEVVAAADGSIAALLGASPGSSTAATTMVDLIKRCFPDVAGRSEFGAALERIIPSHGRTLDTDGEILAGTRTHNEAVLGLQAD